MLQQASDSGPPDPDSRCNLSCTYCNEYDDHSDPVPTSELFRRIDRLASMGTSIITISGGEPLLHPDLDEIICRIRRQRMIAGLLTNGYLLTEERIRSLNRAGLDHMQISVDNVQPDDTSKKSLKVLDKKLELLAQHALFQVNLNSVLGAGVEHPEDALAIARRALELGMGTTVGIIHDGSGQLSALSRNERRIFEQVKTISKKSFGRINVYNPFQKKLVAGKPTTGGVVEPDPATSTFVKTVWGTTVPSSEVIRASRWKTIRPSAGGGNT